MTQYIIGVDLGGTRLRAARFDRDLNLLVRDEVLTLAAEGPPATIERMKALIRSVLPSQGEVAGIGISAPGPSNPFTGIVVAPPNLPGWHNVPIVQILRDAFNLPVYLGNDANVAALAEVVRGAGQGTSDAIFITVSTGIGGGIIINGRMLLGSTGLGAEVGHIVMIVDGQPSTLEKEAAGPALARRARSLIESGRDSQIVDMVDGDLSKIAGATVGTAAQNGDALALEVVQRAGRILGMGMTSLLHIFNPEILIFGGGVSQLGELLFAPMRAAIEECAIDRSYWAELRIVPAGLGENVSLVGAAALVITHGGVESIGAVKEKLQDS
ncbi:MAG: ROK family protein [Aggregatilineales bacterium]